MTRNERNDKEHANYINIIDDQIWLAQKQATVMYRRKENVDLQLMQAKYPHCTENAELSTVDFHIKSGTLKLIPL